MCLKNKISQYNNFNKCFICNPIDLTVKREGKGLK